jgi:predicted metalloendopeptidase
MKKHPALLACLVSFGALSQPAQTPQTSEAAATQPPAISGIDLQFVDAAVRAQDDFYAHVDGKWLQATAIPADRPSVSAFTALDDAEQPQLRTLIEDAAQAGGTSPDPDQRKIGDLYASFLDEANVEQLGAKPLQAEFARIEALKDKSQIPALIAHYNRIGVAAPYDIGVSQDARDSTRYAVGVQQSGLSLPDRDYYLQNDAKLGKIRGQYQAHVGKMLRLVGDRTASADAKAILALETDLAKVQWTKVDNRDPVKTYNKVEIDKLSRLTPKYDWTEYLQAADLAGRIDYVIVGQPSYLAGFKKILDGKPLTVWKAYFRWHVLHAYARYLSKPFVDESFAFYGTALNGIPENRPRWKRGVALVDDSLGEALGKLYVDRYFPPESKARMQAMVANLLATYRQSIDNLDWMGPDTKMAAQAKLAKLVTKIGYPNKWRDYSTLRIARNDLVGNVTRATEFEYSYDLNKLGKPIDREEWEMTPQTINAYYEPQKNEIVFPAAILQPPFFDPKADDAVNYGSIGAIIGHEISHGFDDEGSQFDADGNLHDWFTKEDHAKYAAKTAALVAQYGAYVPVPGYPINGKLTLGENIADNAGLYMAYKAYRLSLHDGEAPRLDGLTGDERFYMGWAQAWRTKIRENAAIMLIKSDPHSIPEFRVNGSVVNQPGFYRAFTVKEGDKLYLPPDRRVVIWGPPQ